MRPIVVTTFTSLDGVMEAPGGGDHPHAGWTFNDVDFVEEAYDIKIGSKGIPLTGDETRESWPSTYKVRDNKRRPGDR